MSFNTKLKPDVEEFVPKNFTPRTKDAGPRIQSRHIQIQESSEADPADQCYSLFPAKKKKARSKKSPEKWVVETSFKVANPPAYKLMPRVKNVPDTSGGAAWPGLEDTKTVVVQEKKADIIPTARSFADMVKKPPQSLENTEQGGDKEENKLNDDKRLQDRLKLSKNNTAMTSILLNRNQISATTYGRIGKSDDESKYVMSSKINADLEAKVRPPVVVRHELEVEFKEPDFYFSSDDDFEVEFSASAAAPRPGKNVVNKISAMTFQQIGKTSDNEKYVMKPKSWSSIVGKGLKTVKDPNSNNSFKDEVPETEVKPKGEPTIHDKIRAKMKENVELTPEEREILRQKRRERRKREKENKRKDKEDEKRKEMLKPQTSKLKLISSNILDQVKQSTVSVKDNNNIKDKGIKFLDEEYPDLGVGSKKSLQGMKKEKVIFREIRDENGKLTSDRESNSEWETEDDSKDASEVFESDANSNVKINVITSAEPISYSSILKSKKKPESLKAPVPVEKSIVKAVQEKSEEKKKVKKKDPIALDIFTAMQVKKQQPKKNAAVLAGKLKKEPIVRAVRNQLDSSAPTKKRGKEREGGKKKKKTLMKKIILADREKRRLLREEAEKRREERIKSGISLKPLPQKDDDFNLVSLPSVEIKLGETDDVKEEVRNVEKQCQSNDGENKISETDNSQEKSSSVDLLSETKNDPTEAEDVKAPLEMSTEEKAMTAIHSRKFRSYCTHLLCPELDTTISVLMSDLVRFQDKQHAKDPVKAKARRRFVVGLREVAKFLKVKKISCIILAPDIERVETEGGLDDAVTKLISDAKAQEITSVFGLNRRKLGKLCLKKVPVSCIGIMNYQGSDENYKKMLSMTSTLTETYQARLQAEIVKIVCPPPPPPLAPSSSSSLSTTAAAFVPSASQDYYHYYGNYCDYNTYYESNYYYAQDYNYAQDYKQNMIDILRQ